MIKHKINLGYSFEMALKLNKKISWPHIPPTIWNTHKNSNNKNNNPTGITPYKYEAKKNSYKTPSRHSCFNNTSVLTHDDVEINISKSEMHKT